MNVIPSTFVGAFAEGDILQVLVIAVLFGAALSLIGERGKPVAHLIELTTDVLFKIIGFIVRLAPLGVFGAIAYTVGSYGVGSLQQLGYLVVLYYASVAIFVFGILGLIMRLAGFSIFKFLALPARGADDRARHRLVGQRAAADHAQARAHGDQGLDRRPRHPDRLLVQPRRLLDLPDARHRLHRPGDQHAARLLRPAC